MDDGPAMLLEIMGTDDFPPKKSWQKLAGFPSPHRHHIEVTIQYLTILVEPSKRSKESKKRVGFGVFRVRPLEMWQEVNGSCSLDLNRQEIIKGPTSTLLKFDQFLPRRRHPEFWGTFPSVLLSPQKLPPSPNRRTSKTYEG